VTTESLRRDRRLGEALRELPVAEHADRFWVDLDERLLDDRRARRLALGDGDGDSDGDGQAADAPPPPAGGPGVRTIRSRPYTQDPSSIVLELARHAGDLTPNRRAPYMGRAPRRLGVGVALVVIALLAIGAVAWLVGREPDAEEVAANEATAAVGEIAAAMSSPESLSGGLTVTEFTAQTGVPEPIGRGYTFVWRVDGSYRFTAGDGTFDEAYDAALGTRRSVQVAPGFGTVARDDANLAPGPPDGNSPSLPLATGILAVFRSVLANPAGATVVEEIRDGRPVEVVDTPIFRPSEPGPDRARLAVDPESHLPVAVSFFTGDQPWEDIRVDNLAVDAPLGAENFALGIPGGAQVTATDAGYRRVASPAEATAAVGYAASVPSYIPDGFKLAEVAIAGQGQSPGPVNTDGTQGPPQTSEGIILLNYRRGFEQLVVTTRRGVTPPSNEWTDPFGTPPGGAGRPIELDSGRFEGVTVESVQAQPAVPHLWGHTDELVFTVAGVLPATELTRVAESLD
jgi:hypothetical protein